MASGVFGTPISKQTVQATGEYKESPDQYDAADYALKMINGGGKDINAQQYVDDLKDRFGNGISTKCLIYNATGTTLKLVNYNDWHGHVYATPYPSTIQNGQWGAFLHVKSTSAATGSTGAVVYRTDPFTSKKKKQQLSVCDWLFSWTIPYLGGSNGVYTHIAPENFSQNWDNISSMLVSSTYTSSNDFGGYTSRGDIGEGTTVNARAIFTLPPKPPLPGDTVSSRL